MTRATQLEKPHQPYNFFRRKWTAVGYAHEGRPDVIVTKKTPNVGACVAKWEWRSDHQRGAQSLSMWCRSSPSALLRRNCLEEKEELADRWLEFKRATTPVTWRKEQAYHYLQWKSTLRNHCQLCNCSVHACDKQWIGKTCFTGWFFSLMHILSTLRIIWN